MFQALKYLPAEIAGVPGEMLGVFFFGALAFVLVAAAAARPRRLRGPLVSLVEPTAVVGVSWARWF